MLESLNSRSLNGHLNDSNNNDDPDDEEESSVQQLTPRRLRGRLLQRKFKAKAAAAKAHLHQRAQNRSSAIARVWDTLATVRWSNSGGNSGKSTPVVQSEEAILARLELLRNAAEAGFRSDAGSNGILMIIYC